MKKKIIFARMLGKLSLRAIERVAESPVMTGIDLIQTHLDVKTSMAVEQWVAEKGYCEFTKGIGDAADKIGVSTEQLARYCQLAYGKPFLTWRKELRIQEAASLLRERPEMSAAAVGDMVGIFDRPNFRKQFFEVMRCTPNQWRSKFRK